MTDDASDTGGLAGALDALAARGARRADPVRWHMAEAMLRRADAHAGAARHLIERRLAALVEGLEAAIDEAESVAGHAMPAGEATPSRPANPSPLAALLAHAKAHAKAPTRPVAVVPDLGEPLPARPVKPAPARPASSGRATRRAEPAPEPVPLAEPPALQYFRRTWSRLKADERLAQSRASLPANAGPLNSHHLVHRALATLHELAPGYYEHFIGHVDDLLWIEAATGAAGPEAAVPARAEGERKGRGR